MDRSVLEITDANRKLLVSYDVHSIFRHKRNMWSGLARTAVENHTPAPGVETWTVSFFIAETISVLTGWLFRNVGR